MRPEKPTEGKPTKQQKEPSNPSTRVRQRGFGVVELLFVASTVGAAVLLAASRGPKLPPYLGY